MVCQSIREFIFASKTKIPFKAYHVGNIPQGKGIFGLNENRDS